jgi:L-ascorbate metabolism protein UlaG (beta-lactamase superfamily)
MHITWFGQSCFKLQDKIGSEGVSVVCDPFDPNFVGLKLPSLEADIVTVSHNHEDHNNIKAIRKDPFVITDPGEYETKGIFIEGILSYHDEDKGAKRGTNVIYRIEVEDISIAHLGDLGTTLDNKQLEKLEGTDILLIPIGGTYTLDAKKAIEVINQIEPRIIIPMHYQVPGLKIKELAGLDKFIAETGLVPTYEDKLKITKRDLPEETMELVVLKIQ